MKRTLSVLLLIGLPALALASGDHAGSHDMEGHRMMQGHDTADMQHDMDDEGHDATAGRPGDPAKVDRIVEIIMDDTMRYTPSAISVNSGETIRFFIRNMGRTSHEMVLGPLDELMEHAEMMRKMPDMQHSEPNMIRLAPGQRGGLVWQFDVPGTVNFACLMPGHMEAGMTGRVEVK